MPWQFGRSKLAQTFSVNQRAATSARTAAHRPRKLQLESLEGRRLLTAVADASLSEASPAVESAPIAVQAAEPIDNTTFPVPNNPFVQFLPGDANIDGAVDYVDYQIWHDHFLTPEGVSYADGDFNLDGVVDAGDYTIWADNFGDEPAEELAAAVAVAEQSAATDALTGEETASQFAAPTPSAILPSSDERHDSPAASLAATVTASEFAPSAKPDSANEESLPTGTIIPSQESSIIDDKGQSTDWQTLALAWHWSQTSQPTETSDSNDLESSLYDPTF